MLTMQKFSLYPSFKLATVALALTLSACTPKYDWREVRGTNVPFMVMMPAKPATYARPVNLDGLQVTMTMTAAEVDDVTFAIGTAELPNAANAPAALNAMKIALVKNIGGTIKSEQSSVLAQSPGTVSSQIDIEATGAPGGNTGGQPRLLVARFVAIDKRIYQAVVVGREKAVTRDAVDTFLTSFKLN
jgi:hypothetical protein